MVVNYSVSLLRLEKIFWAILNKKSQGLGGEMVGVGSKVESVRSSLR